MKTKVQIQREFIDTLKSASIYQRSLVRREGKRRMQKAFAAIGITGIAASNAIHEATEAAEMELAMREE